MKTFSQRKKLKHLSETIQTDSMNAELRNSLWNVLDSALWSNSDFLYGNFGALRIDPFSKALWFDYFKQPIDTRPGHSHQILAVIRKYFFECKWFEVYDFLEFVVAYCGSSGPRLAGFINAILERELSGYRFVGGHLTDITSEQELKMLEATLADNRFAGVAAHLERALDLYASRDNPDYRNSIKESISAVESMARIAANDPKATLSDALKALEVGRALHPSLKDGFIKLYGYTSDEGGIRHAMLEKPDIKAADARYFLLSCTSFVNYLKSQLK